MVGSRKSASAAVLCCLSTAGAFAPSNPCHGGRSSPHVSQGCGEGSTTSSTVGSSTSLDALPPLIIGPMIRRMTGGGEKNNMPMANYDEAMKEAPGLRVGAEAWKWPPVWPYDGNFFKRQVELDNAKTSSSPLSMINNLGEAAENASEEGDAAKKEVSFDSLEFWQGKGDVKTEIDSRTVEKITNHYSFYLRDGMSVLELGAADNSYLPETLKLNSHVGVGAVQSQMDSNPSITSSFVVDLNDVVEDDGLSSDEWKEKIEDNSFDAIIMANTIDFLNNPREVFKSAWRALKPGGVMIVPFLSKDAYVSEFGDAFTKQWRDMTDDQHMWVCGSFFQFSAGDGWEKLQGFDVSPEEAGDKLNKKEGLFDKLKGGNDDGTPPGAYVVQARKKAELDPTKGDVEEVIRSRMWMMPTLEDRDKKLVAPRLSRAYDVLGDEDKERMMSHLNSLPAIYESLIKMDQFAFGFSMQAQLAADLVGDPDFVGSDEQIKNMKMGLGLRRPSEDFWAPVGKLTGSMSPEDKVNLLAYIVPRTGSGDAAQEEALQAFVDGLEPTFDVVRSKIPTLSEADVQLLGSELLAAEILIPGRSTREQFAQWIDALTAADLEFILAKRKSYKEEASKEMEEFKFARDEVQKKAEERREKIREQVMEARENRSVIFNPGTGRFEKYEQKEEGFKLPGF